MISRGGMSKISQKSDDFFTFRSYLLDDGQDAIRGWFNRQSAEVQADVMVGFKTLRETPRRWWRRRRFAILGRRGDQTACASLLEIRITGTEDNENEHYRILGYFGPSDGQVTMLMAFKKDDDPDYSRSCPEAQARKLKVEDEPSRSQECSL